MSEKLPIHKIKRLKKGVYNKKKGFFVHFPRGKVILIKETEKAYLVREQLLKEYYPEKFSIYPRWLPKWGVEIKERVGWNNPTSHKITYDKPEKLKSIQLIKKINGGK